MLSDPVQNGTDPQQWAWTLPHVNTPERMDKLGLLLDLGRRQNEGAIKR